MTHADPLSVEVVIGAAVYEASVGLEGGVIEIDHEGTPLTFDLDCARETVLCPTEIWPATLTMGEQAVNSQSEVPVDLPTHACVGEVVAADPEACGLGTDNPTCDWVCDGEVVIEDREWTAKISTSDETFSLIFANFSVYSGSPCVLQPFSRVEADIVSAGSEVDEAWEAESLSDGALELVYSGQCLSTDLIDDPAVAEATLTVRTSFEATRAG